MKVKLEYCHNNTAAKIYKTYKLKDKGAILSPGIITFRETDLEGTKELLNDILDTMYNTRVDFIKKVTIEK